MATLNLIGGVRQKRYRSRQRERRAVGRIEYEVDAVHRALLDTGRLSEAAICRRDLVERELTRIIEEWVEDNT
jgi:hypothetical protein